MSEKGILFSGKMVRAILDGRKSMTRRVIKPQPVGSECFGICTDSTDTKNIGKVGFGEDEQAMQYIKQPFKSGDTLYVKETWARGTNPQNPSSYFCYRADMDENAQTIQKWNTSLFMPKEAARIYLRVTDVSVEKLQDISVQDALDEGIRVHANGCIDGLAFGCYNGDECHYNRCTRLIEYFRKLWDKLSGKRKNCTWSDNPYVWVIEFERIEEE